MKNIIYLFSYLLIAFNTFAEDLCLAEGEKCYSPYIQHTPCCEGLSCKAVKHSYRCYPKNCVGAFSPCKQGGPKCCEGECVHNPLSQKYCKPY